MTEYGEKHKHPMTAAVQAGRDPSAQFGLVNTPIYRGSTVLFESLDALEQATAAPYKGVFYGRFGTPTQRALEDALSELEGAHGSVLASSGLEAISLAICAVTSAGSHLLVADSVYGPTRWFCEKQLARFGVDLEFYDPLLGAGIRSLLRPNTAAIFLESPGSLSFEVQDLPAIAAVARPAGVKLLIDSTWATPLHCQPLALGADMVIHALTKYVVGHADAMLGSISCNADSFEQLRETVRRFGAHAAPDDCSLALRGLRSLPLRLRQHDETARALMAWLGQQPEVARILHPDHPDCPGHEIYQRDFSAACGLFSVVLHEQPNRAALAAMVDGMQHFGLGYSWGGYESLILPANPATTRTATAWPHEGQLLRLHAGLEAPADLTADLAAAFERLRRAD